MSFPVFIFFPNIPMAKTAKGQKYNRIDDYKRIVDGKTQRVSAHARSNPCTCKSKRK